MTASGPRRPHAAPPGDLHVDQLSAALAGWHLDVVVAGSIGAVESVRFIRALRRLGATVQPWLTSGGSQFVTTTALAWAAARDVRTGFSGEASHIALSDAVIIAPASASLIGRIANGLTDTPASALITSALGAGKPVLCLPNMHDSLLLAPAVQTNLQKLTAMGVHWLASREEEGKQKFPTPAVLADLVSHQLNSGRQWPDAAPQILVTMGSTRGYIDDVRYLSNYSSGALGSQMAEELYRLGFSTQVVAGPSPHGPAVYGALHEVATNAEMAAAAGAVLKAGAAAAILAASVLDFTPSAQSKGKISSREHERFSVELVRTPKIIATLNPKSGIKVGFKLETGLTEAKARALAAANISDYGLSLIVLNDLADVGPERHTAYLVTPGSNASSEGQHSDAAAATSGESLPLVQVQGKRAVAHAVAAHVARQVRALAPPSPPFV